jgi:hypothetical protein
MKCPFILSATKYVPVKMPLHISRNVSLREWMAVKRPHLSGMYYVAELHRVQRQFGLPLALYSCDHRFNWLTLFYELIKRSPLFLEAVGARQEVISQGKGIFNDQWSLSLTTKNTVTIYFGTRYN